MEQKASFAVLNYKLLTVFMLFFFFNGKAFEYMHGSKTKKTVYICEPKYYFLKVWITVIVISKSFSTATYIMCMY